MIWAPGIVILIPSLVLSEEKVFSDLELLKLPLALAFQNANPPLTLNLVVLLTWTACVASEAEIPLNSMPMFLERRRPVTYSGRR